MQSLIKILLLLFLNDLSFIVTGKHQILTVNSDRRVVVVVDVSDRILFFFWIVA
jgi:hypothetical protein